MRLNRTKKLYDVLEEQAIDAALIFSRANRYYFSGFTGSSGYLVMNHPSEQYLLTDFRYGDQAKDEAPLFQVEVKQQPLLESAALLLKKMGARKVGIEYQQMSYHDVLLLKKLLPDAELADIEPAIMNIRMIKDEEEIENFRRGIEICDQAFNHILTFIKEGVTEQDIGLELEYFMKKQGAGGIKENHVIASGERSSLPHGQATDRVIRQGDFVKMDYGAKVNGYYTDFTRTVVVGEPDEKQLEIYDIVRRAQEASLQALKPGETCKDMDEVGRSIIRDAGYGENFGHSLGHSIGLAVHESPALRSTDETVLQPGMVITVEPGIYIPGFGGVRIEDFVVIREDGIENLTKSTKDLQIL